MSMVVDLHPNQFAEQLTGRPYTSWSAITTYTACPLRYQFRYVENLPEGSVSASLVFGGAIHRGVEYHFTELLEGNPPPPLESMLAAYHEGWQEHEAQAVQFGKADGRATLDDLAGRVLAAFQASDFAMPTGTIIGIEEELTGVLVPGVPDLLARVDLLVDEGDALVLTDLKTSRSRWSPDQVQDSAGQLLLYHELAKPLADGRPIRLQFAVATKAKSPDVAIYPVEPEPQQIGRTKQIIERAWAGIQAGIFYPAPSPAQCRTCPFRAACQDWSG